MWYSTHTVCLGSSIFRIFIVMPTSIGVLLKGRVKSSLLFEDELLTLDIDGVMSVLFLEGGLKTRKLAKIGLPNFSF